jgi:peptide/nickel transport system substrate-binding protein
VSVRLTNPFSSYNDGTADDNGLWNQEVLNAVLPTVAKFDDQGSVVVDQNLVSVTKTSDHPLVVHYAFNPAAIWNDGQPVGCDDIYLAWIANNGATTSSGAGTTATLFQTASTTGWDEVSSVTCSPDGRTATLAYASPFADWESLVGGLMPAHIVASRAGLGSTAGIRAAYEAHDQATLEKIATFWNTGFKTDQPFDPAVDLSAGPFKISAIEPDQSVTLVRNDHYWGPPAHLDSVVFRVVSDGPAQVQALANRELDVIQTGGSQPDALALLKGLAGVTTTVAGSDAFEHFDFNFQVPVLEDRAVRQAVAQCIPRTEIVDKLVKPTNDHAGLQQNRMFYPGQPGYTDTSGGRYDAVDPAGAKATLQADGWTLGGSVFAKNGQRLEFHLLHSASRSAEAELIEASCAQAGISMVDDSDAKWGTRLGNGQFETVLYTTIASPRLSSLESSYRTPPSPQNLLSNYGDYSNPHVDDLMNTLESETDPAKLVAAANEADTVLWDDVATIPLWQYPQVTAYSNDVRGVKPNPTQQGLTWNLETWSKT